jgi:hypothetical protein
VIVTVVLPLALLGAVAWLLPRGLARWLPRSLGGLVANGAMASVLLLGLGAALFAWLYGPSAGLVWDAAPGHFLVLSARAALLWGPILVLGLADLPRRWPTGDWAVPGADGVDSRDRPR